MIHAPKHWAYRRPDGEYITDPEIRDGTEKALRVRFVTDSDYRKLIKPVNAAAIKRVLTLVDGYLSTLPQETLTAWDGGMMTWAELRQHVQAASKLAGPSQSDRSAEDG